MVEGVVSTPNVGLMLRVSPVIILFDELSYYAYHSTRYDRGFTFIA